MDFQIALILGQDGITNGAIYALLALALVLDAVAQATGFAFGAGRSAVKAGLYDLDREPHLDAADRARFMA